MSTDLRDPASTPPADKPAPDEKPKPALSLTQVIGGALAAMTAAFLGSRLSVAGTVIGAALASVVAAVGGAVYTSSIRRTSRTVSTVWRTVVRPDGHGGTETVTERVTPGRAAEDPAADPSPAAGSEAEDRDGDGLATPRSTSGTAPGRRIGWKPVAAAAVLIFAIAAVALTGFELATGSALSGGSGTTVGRVAEVRTDRTPKPTATRSASAEPTASASSGPSAAPAPGGSAAPSEQPTAQPTQQPTDQPTAEPTTAPAPTTGTGSAPGATGAPSASAAQPTVATSAAAGQATP